MGTASFITAPALPALRGSGRATAFTRTPPRHRGHPRTSPCPASLPTPATCSANPDEAGPAEDPASDPAYTAVRAYSFSTCHTNCALLTLIPVSGGPVAFKMSVTTQQADAIRASLRARDPRPPPPRLLRRAPGPSRPSTHDLLASIVSGAGAVVTHAAITHMQGDVFVARVYLRAGGQAFEVDARPSDALILTARSAAPLYLRASLLRQWGVSVKNVEYDFRQGRCDIIDYADNMKATVDLAADVLAGKRDVLELAILRSRLDLAVRAQRFREAAHIQKHIDLLCPIDSLKKSLEQAVEEQRFKDAELITNQLCEWKRKLRAWEKGQIDLHKEYEEKLGGAQDSAFADNPERYRSKQDDGKSGPGHNTFRGLGI